MMIRSIRTENWRLPVLLLLGLAFLFGCSDEPGTPEDPNPQLDPTINGMLGRVTGAGDGSQRQDDLLIWIDDVPAAGLEAMRLAGLVDDEPAPGNPDGIEFAIVTEPGTTLFTAGQAVTVEFLGAAGGVAATAVFEGPDAELNILAPVSNTGVSLEGFTLNWSSDGDGSVIIELTSLVLDHRWETTTGNDGSYELSADDLSGFPRGACRIRISQWSDTALTSVQLGVGNMILVMTGQVEVSLGL